MTPKPTYRSRLKRIVFFFPFQLLVLHLKRNHLLVLCWLVLFGYITQNISVKYGLPNLFLYPEYFGEVNMLSYGIVGFTFGGFITAFNLYSYIMHGFRFPFIATLSRPFLKFSINNFIIPALFLLVFALNSFQFQVQKELIPVGEALLNVLGALMGTTTFFLISNLYFSRTNTDMRKFENSARPADDPMHDIGDSLLYRRRSAEREAKRGKWHVETYLSNPFKILLARSIDHYDKALIMRILRQNHVNGSIFEVLLIISFLLFGALSDMAFFAIPAAASVVLLFTMLIMLISAVFSWFKGWTLTILIGAFLLVNFLSTRSDLLDIQSHVMGLQYTQSKASFDKESIEALAYDTKLINADIQHELNGLESWKVNTEGSQKGRKPKLVLLNVSGGGMRSMLWTLRSMQYLDSILNGTLMARTRMITGSSGGMITATYFREMHRARSWGVITDLQDPVHEERLTNEVLNTVAFSLATNDVMVRYKRVRDGENTYTRDRGFEFERRLVEMSDGVLGGRVMDAAEDVQEGIAPMIILSPTVINDGHRLLISSQPLAYLANNQASRMVNSPPIVEDIEFNRFFAAQGAADLKMSSALRMNATFPFILPVMSLPSEPTMQVMDAGLRDNYGMLTTMKYLHTFSDWIDENTSGVVIIQVRDKQKDLRIEGKENSLISRLTTPVGSVYDNFVKVQDYDHDRLLLFAESTLNVPLDVVPFQLRHSGEEAITLSWRLTALEKQRIRKGVYSKENRLAGERLLELTGMGNGLGQSPASE